ncbi:unnamed protein product [Medioppia subpectinata]|uniref:CAAX prenyl protease 2 n=1 Tax=Medioppia subpectinata TaxID=1979941 RepID=A0A7R9KYY3_9ACAR|nr:unnamed protein product [Medioppia subpectinata]CAG2111254.1 unnamed protein product [Medioppia subpectinata]
MARERTHEFFSTVKSIEGKPQYMNNELRSRRTANKWSNGSVNHSLQSSTHYKTYVQFMRGSRSVARDLFSTYQKLEKINVLAQKKTIFDGEEASKELNELVYIVKQDITSLNQQIESLRQQQLQQLHQQNGQNIDNHSKNVVLTLQHQLANISSNFKNTLQLRTQNMAQQKLRREQFTTSAAMPSHVNSTVIDLSDDLVDTSGGREAERREQKQLLIYEDQSNDYLEERASTMHSIESTIVELGTIFTQLASMVQQQEEMITRIDANVTDTALNVEAAHQSLLQYFSSVTNNRWLIIKRSVDAMDTCLITSTILSFLVSFIYVGSLYCWPKQTHRDNPETIKRRFVSVFGAILLSIIVLIVFNGDRNVSSLAMSLGVHWPQHLSTTQLILNCILLPLMQTSVLFMGPIVINLIQAKDSHMNRKNIYTIDLIVIRNYMIAPITEELIFRGVLSTLLDKCWSLNGTLIISSLLFGFSHSHHYLFEVNDMTLRRRGGRRSWWPAIEQMTYTSLFAMYACLLYLRSHRFIITPILVHSFCNLMGFPDLEAIASSKPAITLTATGFVLWLLSVSYVYSSL